MKGSCIGCRFHGHDGNTDWDRDDTCCHPRIYELAPDYTPGEGVPVLGNGCNMYEARA